MGLLNISLPWQINSQKETAIISGSDKIHTTEAEGLNGNAAQGRN